MTKNITKAQVIGKSQNRTALGMMNAYIAMHPKTTIMDLKTKFTKQKVCPDTGIGGLFYTQNEIEQEKLGRNGEWFSSGNACFIKDGEWLTLSDGQKLAFNKVWTANSLTLLQNEMAKYNIVGEVGSVSKDSQAGFMINYEYDDEYDEEPSKGIPLWVWVLIPLLVIVGYFAIAMMGK